MLSIEITNRVDAAKRAVGSQMDLLHREFGRAKSEWKSDGSRVTAVDLAISQNIFRMLAEEFPKDQYFSEELTDAPKPIPVTARFSWVLDPIDGTNNFALGLPHCAIALALCDAGEPIYGVVYDLSRRVVIHGGPRFGMHDGARTTSVVTAAPGPETLIGFHSPFDKKLLPQADAVLSQFKIRGLGSATLHLAYVAAGLLDGCVDFNVKIWDLAAAIPLVRAAGGEVRFLSGEQLPMKKFDLKMKRIIYVAGSPQMCDRLVELMKLKGK